MSKPRLTVLALASVLFAVSSPAQPWATSVISYSAGTGGAAGYDNPDNALGEPSRTTQAFPSGTDPVTPFNPAWPASQLVSIGAGGSLTLQFGQTVHNAAGNPFGIDFIIFGNNGFTITNGNFSGGGITDGTTFTFDSPGASRVLVSADNVSYFELVAPPGITATVDGLFPTDGSGDFQRPVNPTLTGADFAGKNLDGIRALYAGSAGGTGFDLSWGPLSDINYLRVEVSSGKLEIDGIAVVPEPGTWALLGLSAFLSVAAYRRRWFSK